MRLTNVIRVGSEAVALLELQPEMTIPMSRPASEARPSIGVSAVSPYVRALPVRHGAGTALPSAGVLWALPKAGSATHPVTRPVRAITPDTLRHYPACRGRDVAKCLVVLTMTSEEDRPVMGCEKRALPPRRGVRADYTRVVA